MGELHICGCVTHFDEDRWTSVTDSQCEFHAEHYPVATPAAEPEPRITKPRSGRSETRKHGGEVTTHEDQIRELTEAIRLTVEYVGVDILPPIEGWSWYDALSKYAPETIPPFVDWYEKHGELPRMERAEAAKRARADDIPVRIPPSVGGSDV